MNDFTLESLAARLSLVEAELALLRERSTSNAPKKDWRRVVGIFDDDPDFYQDVIAEGRAIREAEREAAIRGETE